MSGPIYIDWVITSKCNLNCRHCVGMEEGELTHDEAIKVTSDIIKLSPQWVILEGGEPHMHHMERASRENVKEPDHDEI